MTANVGIGRIKWLDADKKRGVISPQEITKMQSGRVDLYFVAADSLASGLKVGQLVQYVVDASGKQAEEVAVLSELA